MRNPALLALLFSTSVAVPHTGCGDGSSDEGWIACAEDEFRLVGQLDGQTIDIRESMKKLDVDYLDGEEAVVSARFKQPDSKTTVFRHIVRLQPGEYRALVPLHWTEGPATERTRRLVVPAEGVVRFDLREEIPKRSE